MHCSVVFKLHDRRLIGSLTVHAAAPAVAAVSLPPAAAFPLWLPSSTLVAAAESDAGCDGLSAKRLDFDLALSLFSLSKADFGQSRSRWSVSASPAHA